MAAISEYPADISDKHGVVVQASTTARHVDIDPDYEWIVKHAGREVDATIGPDPVVLSLDTAPTLSFAADNNKHVLEAAEVWIVPAGHAKVFFGLLAGAATNPVLAITRSAYKAGQY